MTEAGEDCALIVGGETLLNLIYEPSEKCLKEIEHLDFFRRRDLPATDDYYFFDIEPDGDRPAKFQKQQIYEILKIILHYVTVKYEYFYSMGQNNLPRDFFLHIFAPARSGLA